MGRADRGNHAGVQRDPDVELTLPPRPESIAVARHVAAGVGEALGVAPERAEEIVLVVSEAVTLGVRVGGHDPVEVAVWGEPGRVAVRVTHAERAVEPDEVGAALIEALADEVTWAAHDGSRRVDLGFAGLDRPKDVP